MDLMKKVSAIEIDISEIKNLLKSSTNSQRKEILTAQETMDLLQIQRSTFRQWRELGIIKVYTINRRLYCKYSEIMEALENGIIGQKNQ